jgi:hypothetical protein
MYCSQRYEDRVCYARAGDFRSLCERLQDLEAGAGGAPLVCVTEQEADEAAWKGLDILSDDGRSDAGSVGVATAAEAGKREDWEML